MASDKAETDNLSMSPSTEIATSINGKNDDNKSPKSKKMINLSKKRKNLVTKMPEPDEEKASSSNTRGIPRAVYIDNPYDIVYQGKQERYLREVEEVLGYDYVLSPSISLSLSGPALRFCDFSPLLSIDNGSGNTN